MSADHDGAHTARVHTASARTQSHSRSRSGVAERSPWSPSHTSPDHEPPGHRTDPTNRMNGGMPAHQLSIYKEFSPKVHASARGAGPASREVMASRDFCESAECERSNVVHYYRE